MASTESLAAARASYADSRWQTAVDQLRDADREVGLAAEDLELLANATVLTGRMAEGIDVLTRAHERFLADGDEVAAARCAAWIGMHLMQSGEHARGGGWFSRAHRLVDGRPDTTSVEGFLLVPVGLNALYSGDPEAAAGLFRRAAEIGERHRDSDVTALGRLGMGQAEIMVGRESEGLILFDEVMVAVTAGELSPIPAGIVYCAVIDGCQLAFDLRRAREWTTALDRWCEAQPDLVPFSGQCRAHRAELYLLHGAWSDALDAARSAQDALRRGDRYARFGAFYYEAEVQRLSGDLTAAERSYRAAHESGWEPEPGQALLRLAQGEITVAQTLIRRAVEGTDLATRRRRLPARVEIELAAGDVPAARSTADELIAVSRSSPMPIVHAIAHQAHGAVLLDEDDPRAAAPELRRAWSLWMELDVPYEAARCRALTGRAYRALGDHISSAMEFDAARAVLLDLGAAPALAELDAMSGAGSGSRGHSLTPREVEVVRLVATGATNRLIGRQLYLSEKTVARHLSNIFVKLEVSSRSAVTAYAYEHNLVAVPTE